jgi:hypothetical protein
MALPAMVSTVPPLMAIVFGAPKEKALSKATSDRDKKTRLRFVLLAFIEILLAFIFSGGRL